MPKKEPLYPHVPKSKLGAFICGQCGERFHSTEELNKHLAEYHPEAYASVSRAELPEEKRVLVALTRDELDILEGVVREELGLITEGELKAIILKATGGASSWVVGLTPLLTVLAPR